MTGQRFSDTFRGFSNQSIAGHPNACDFGLAEGQLKISVAGWARMLPHKTLAVYDPGTVLPVREIAAILQTGCPAWSHEEVPTLGHMAPLTRPDIINPIVASFLDA